MDALVRYPWPGNVRELQNVIERAVILSPKSTLYVPISDLELGSQLAEPSDLGPATHPGSIKSDVRSAPPAETLADAERDHILKALRETHWVVGGPKGAAVRLGMKRSTLQKKMKKLGISRPA
jgi:formate hydrogenlyase transcriptional activator